MNKRLREPLKYSELEQYKSRLLGVHRSNRTGYLHRKKCKEQEAQTTKAIYKTPERLCE